MSFCNITPAWCLQDIKKEEIQTPKQIGDFVKKIRKNKGLSQKQLSKLSNCSQATISKIENGILDINSNIIIKVMKILE